jgi:hypothetical protein
VRRQVRHPLDGQRQLTELTERLPHGYTNATHREGGWVVKHYLGPDAKERRTREVAALRGVAGIVPVPTVFEVRPDAIVLGLVSGTPGQELLVRAPAQVLEAVGRLARTLQRVPPTVVAGLGPVAAGQVLVHGDFGPQNLLIDPDALVITALLDWEFVRIGSPLDDLAWAEWIVRTHHPDLVTALPSLFSGYGSTPAWPDRHAAMLRGCRRLLAFATRGAGPNSAAAQLWEERLRATTAYTA